MGARTNSFCASMMIKTLSEAEAVLGWTPMISRKDFDILLGLRGGMVFSVSW